jgi:hypothetical protein
VRRPPSDFELLREIRDRHHDDYVNGRAGRQSEVFVPIDIPAIAAKLGTTEHSVFGRLYYDMEEKYGQDAAPPGVPTYTPRKSFFAPRLGQEPPDVNCVNFPHMEAVLAGLWVQRNLERRTFWTSVVSLGIALASLTISVLVATGAI